MVQVAKKANPEDVISILGAIAAGYTVYRGIRYLLR
jgi:hypothetical protein